MQAIDYIFKIDYLRKLSKQGGKKQTWADSWLDLSDS